jgi:hypothetical protein
LLAVVVVVVAVLTVREVVALEAVMVGVLQTALPTHLFLLVAPDFSTARLPLVVAVAVGSWVARVLLPEFLLRDRLLALRQVWAVMAVAVAVPGPHTYTVRYHNQ